MFWLLLGFLDQMRLSSHFVFSGFSVLSASYYFLLHLKCDVTTVTIAFLTSCILQLSLCSLGTDGLFVLHQCGTLLLGYNIYVSASMYYGEHWELRKYLFSNSGKILYYCKLQWSTFWMRSKRLGHKTDPDISVNIVLRLENFSVYCLGLLSTIMGVDQALVWLPLLWDAFLFTQSFI